MKGTWNQSLVRELRSHMLWNNEAHALILMSPLATAREPVHLHESSHVPQLRPDTAKKLNKHNNFIMVVIMIYAECFVARLDSH